MIDGLFRFFFVLTLICPLLPGGHFAHASESGPTAAVYSRTLSGSIVTGRFEYVAGVDIEIKSGDEVIKIVSDDQGRFSALVPNGALEVRFSGKNIKPVTRSFGPDDQVSGLQIRVQYTIPPISEVVTIQADSLTPTVENVDGSVLQKSLFGRDDQLFFTLNSGINAGQHEGGGKSLEIRRYGFNTDHGGVNGGLKIVVDSVQQNQGTQGHGQGYLGNLKSLTPELIEDVSIVNGPFSVAYGDFSGLGVVVVERREALPDILTLKLQGGSFGTFRSFVALSPKIRNTDSYIGYEYSRTDGPFLSSLGYVRNNISGNFTRRLRADEELGVRFGFATNSFNSSGQIPLDLINSGELDRFGALDLDSGGKNQAAEATLYYRKTFGSGNTIKANGTIGRSLFDLYSNFTFFLADPLYGDEIQQHDSRLQQGGSFQALIPYSFGGNGNVLTIGSDLLLNQINVGLYPSVGRNPNRKFLPGNLTNPDVLLTRAQANVSNFAGYAQNSMTFLDGHLSLQLGLRWDYFGYDLEGSELSDVETILDGTESGQKLQPKLSLSWSPFETIPISFYANYGRGISSQDARGVIRSPDAPRLSTTDFYQTGGTYNSRRFSLLVTGFLIDRSNEQVYIPDDGTIEFQGPSRSYGFEFRTSARVTSNFAVNAGLTQVLESYFRNTNPREIVDSAPKTVANAGLVFENIEGFDFYLNWRHISNYRLSAFDENVRASGHDVVDFSLVKSIGRFVDFNFSVDNLFNKKYFETQNFFESRVGPTSTIMERIHVTPGYPTTISAGVTFRFGKKK